MNVPKRFNGARADPVVTPRIVENWRDQCKVDVSGPLTRGYQSSANDGPTCMRRFSPSGAPEPAGTISSAPECVLKHAPTSFYFSIST